MLQGGGALGSYQAGVYQALHEAGVEPDWVVGTSIGAINGALITGNPPEVRVAQLREFWRQIAYEWPLQCARMFPFIGQATANLVTMTAGNPEFFVPNPRAVWDLQARLGPEQAGFYSVQPLHATLDTLIAADAIGREHTRLTVGAARVTTSEMVYFDSDRMDLTLDHIMASGALPPAFPAVRVGDELFWDGGTLSNTPLEIIFEENPRRPSLIFEVQLWNPEGDEPTTMFEVMTREKDVRYSSRSATQVLRQKQLHKLRHIIGELASRLPEAARADPEVVRMAGYGCATRMHVVRLMAPRLEHDDYSKDIDFSASGIAARWQAGHADTVAVLAQAPWTRDVDPMEGVIVHEARAGEVMATS